MGRYGDDRETDMWEQAPPLRPYTPPAPVQAGLPAGPLPQIDNPFMNQTQKGDGGGYDAPPVQLPSGPAPGQNHVPTPPTAPAGPVQAAPQAGQWSANNQGFLDWANKTYGQDAVRGNSFVNAKAGGGFEKMLADYAAASGNKATFLGGPSGDRADFGQGVEDALTSDGMVWNAAGGKGKPGAGGGSAPGGGYTLGGGGGGDFGTGQIGQAAGKVKSKNSALAEDALGKYLTKGGDLNLKLESLREKFGIMQRAQMNDARGELASRGLLSEGSTAQGPEMSTLGRVNSNIAPQWAQATRDAYVEDNANMLQAIGLATGLDEKEADRALASAHNDTERQAMLNDMAIKSLDQNRMWNQFLAEFGLKRDTIMYQLQNDQTNSMAPLIKAFTDWTNSASGGYVK